MHFLLPQFRLKKGKSPRLLEMIQPMIEYSQNEKGNSSYMFFQGIENEDQVFGIESYFAKSNLYEEHMASKEFKTLIAAIGEGDMNDAEPLLIDATPVLGFVTRTSGTRLSGHYIWYVEMTCKSSEARDLLITLAKPLVTHVKNQEPKTNSYLFLKDDANEKKIFIFEMYDSEAALADVHRHSEAFLAFKQQVVEKDLVESRWSGSFKTSGHGYLCKDGKSSDF